MLQTSTRAQALAARYASVRSATEALVAPLSAEDQQIQSMPDASPTKWHRAHTTWFFETFLLKAHLPDYVDFDENFGFLFNSYYEAVGARHPRPHRGLLSRPSAETVGQYRQAVDGSMIELLATDLGARAESVLDLIELGLNHEQQHQELILMDIKHVLSVNPTDPQYRAPAPTTGTESPQGWVHFDGGIHSVGHAGSDFAFDNEAPRHDVLLRPYALADRLVTAGEWLEFIADGGYERSNLWLSEGWHTVSTEGWSAPLYWFNSDGEWQVFTLEGVRPVDPAEPVCHISLYEADAFARWAGARLPLEAEWEHAAAALEVAGNFADSGAFHPRAADPQASGLRQMFGDVWEWTASPYVAYPRFAPAPGAVGEYNGKFMMNQMVLRGGCCATPDGHTRPTYRNFFPAHARWMFSGLRLAKDLL